MRIINWFKPSVEKISSMVDSQIPTPPYYLRAENLFSFKNGREIFIKKIFSIARNIKKKGVVIFAPGLANNSNIFRLDDQGNVLLLNHNRSFANLLASEGYIVYLYHPTYSERVYNRYVCRYCPKSVNYQKRYDVSSSLSFVELLYHEVPQLIEFVANDSSSDQISWIGYSLGGILIYNYLIEHRDSFIKNIVTIASPITFNQISIRLVPYINYASKTLGFEERTFLGTISENFIPLTRIINSLPGWALRFNILTPLVCNPFNISTKNLQAVLDKIIEPVPSGLDNCFSKIIMFGFPPFLDNMVYLNALRDLRYMDKNFLFFFGTNDLMAQPDSICLAHEIITPNDSNNLIKVLKAGHLDIIVGNTSRKTVWIPTLKWLDEKGM